MVPRAESAHEFCETARQAEDLGCPTLFVPDHFDDLEIQTLVGFVHYTEDASSIADVMAGGFGVSPKDALDAPVTLVGTENDMTELLETRRARWQMSYHVIPREAMVQFARVPLRRHVVSRRRGTRGEAVPVRGAVRSRRVGE
jgi:hypothetical protein